MKKSWRTNRSACGFACKDRETNTVNKPEFEIVISKTGKVTVEVKGVKGPRCLEYAEVIKEIVGREEERHLTADYYAPEGEVRIDVQTKDTTG